MNDGKISYQTSHDVTLIADSQYITVDKSDWDRLKREVDTCKSHTDWWMNIAFACIGISASAFIAWLGLPNEASNNKTITICTSIGFCLIALVCFCAHQTFTNYSKRDIQDVKQVISDIEDKLSPPQKPRREGVM